MHVECSSVAEEREKQRWDQAARGALVTLTEAVLWRCGGPSRMLGSRGCASTDTASTACLSRPKGEQRGVPTAGAGYDIKGGFFLKKRKY